MEKSKVKPKVKSKVKRKNELAIIPVMDNQKGIENHKKIATHFHAAAKSHLLAAKHHQEGNHEKAAQSTITAYGHVSLARKAQKQDIMYHFING